MFDGLQWGDKNGLDFQPIPKIHINDLSYERFIEEFALPRMPVLIVGAGDSWPALQKWRQVSYFLEHECANECFSSGRAANLTSAAPYDLTNEELSEVPADAALRMLQERQEAAEEKPDERNPRRLYIKTWDYVHAGAGALQEDFTVPSIFDKSPRCLTEQVVFGHSARDMKWIYIGEEGTGSPSHIDTNYSSAWLWCARGKKEWRCVHGGDWDRLGYEELNRKGNLPDLFRPDVRSHPILLESRLYEGIQEAGDVMYNPSKCLHAVYNTQFTVSLTHNYVDCSNLADIVADCSRSLGEELLPAAKGLAKEEVLSMLQETLDLPQEVILRSIAALRRIMQPELMELILDTAAEGEGSRVRDMLSKYLDEELVPLLPQFAVAVGALVEAVGAEKATSDSGSEGGSGDVTDEGGFMTDSSDD